MKLAKTLWLALAAAAPLGPLQAAEAAEAGPYVMVAAGRSAYDYDCYFLADCDTGRATTTRLGAGYRFGVFGLELWAADWGRATTRWQDSLRLRSLGAGAVWHLHFSPTVQGLLRAGAAHVTQNRSDDGRASHLEGTFGLALDLSLNPTVGLQAAWDFTTSTGRNSGSVLAQALTAGLRVRF